jgi:hypothetical protein
MGTNIRSILEHGDEGLLIDIERQVTNGLPNIIVVGLATKAVDEAKERVRSAQTRATQKTYYHQSCTSRRTQRK